MNNIEHECFAFVDSILKDRPINSDGEYIKLNKKDREKTIEILNQQKEEIETCKEKISTDCYRLLVNVYDGLTKLLLEKII